MSCGQDYQHPLASLSRPLPPPTSASLPAADNLRNIAPAAISGSPTQSPEGGLSPHSSGALGGTNGYAGKRARTGATSDDEDDKSRKRNRQALSCSSCKRKKIKVRKLTTACLATDACAPTVRQEGTLYLLHQTWEAPRLCMGGREDRSGPTNVRSGGRLEACCWSSRSGRGVPSGESNRPGQFPRCLLSSERNL